MSTYGGMFWLLRECGCPASQARHAEKLLERLRINGWGSDDWAALLFDWRRESVHTAKGDMMTQIEKLQRANVPVTWDMHQLRLFS